MEKENQHSDLNGNIDLNQRSNILYKFRSTNINYHKDVLFEQSIYFPSIKELNDPFDSRISFNFSEMTENEIELYLNKIKFNISDERAIRNYNFFKEMMILKDEKTFEMLRKIDFDATNKFAGIFSTSLKWDNILMWTHYAENHSGFIVGFDEKKDRDSLLFHFGAKVEYPDNLTFPKIQPSMSDLELFYKRFFVKSKDWSYENEFRLINDFRDPDKKRVLNYPIELIAEVIIGFKINLVDKNKIIKFCKQNNISLFQTRPEKYKFQLTRIQI